MDKEEKITKSSSSRGTSWNSIEDNNSGPSARSLHSMVYLDKHIYIFGGYDGSKRTNDFFLFDIYSKKWAKIVTNDMPPYPRERHVAVVHDRSIFIFGGYDGVNKLNDFYEFNIDNNTWSEVIYSGSGQPPSPRHSCAAVVYDGSMYVFGGVSNSCTSDLHRFNFETNTWNEIKKNSNCSWPQERYRTSAAVYKDCLYVYGGHNGGKQLEDFWCFNLRKHYWLLIEVKPNIPSLRDSHITFVYKDSLYIHGGSSANNIYYKGDFFEFNFITQKWISLNYYINDNNSTHVFCHSGVFVDKLESFFIFGGFNGVTRLNDFKYFKFNDDDVNSSNRSKCFLKNMESFINNKKFSDTKIISSEGQIIYGHKIILSRCPYFDNLFSEDFDFKENLDNEVKIDNISYKILLKVITFIYTSNCPIEFDESILLFEAANYFGMEDLRNICEEKILSISNIENACNILQKADQFNSTIMKEKTINFIVDNFTSVVLTDSFPELLKNPDLALEVLRIYSTRSKNQNTNMSIMS